MLIFGYFIIYSQSRKHIKHMSETIYNIAKRWKELSGKNKWEGLLDPLDKDLRRYIIHYGEMAQATYDTFNSQVMSKYAGSSRYSTKNILSEVGLDKGKPLMKYEVVKYFYATSQIKVPNSFILKSLSSEALCRGCNWMGYIAVATDEGKAVLGRRDIVVAWRGTIQLNEWVKDFDALLVPVTRIFGDGVNGKVHEGWLSMYLSSEDSQSPFCRTSAREQVLSEVKKLVSKYKDEEMSITITGHSLGSSLATLNAADIISNKINIFQEQQPPCPVTVFGFASPCIGDPNFCQMVQEMENLNILRVHNLIDTIPSILPIIGYTQVGQELVINYLESPYLVSPGNIKCWHILEVYLHVIAGTQGSKGGFNLEVDRDIALVNKASQALKDRYLVPSVWWCLKNKGMVQGSDGHWELHDQENDDSNS